MPAPQKPVIPEDPTSKRGMKLPRKSKAQKERALVILSKLYEYYPNPHCELNYSNPFELLIATILSAQCTDVRVNMVTEKLFRDFPTVDSFAEASLEALEEAVRPTGFYRNKAKSIKETAITVRDQFGGEVPQTMDELLTMRGAARKTANVVLGNAFGINVGVVVDTHVRRFSNRFGLSKHSNPDKIERDLMALFPRENWTDLSHLMIHHGRACCKARFSTPPDHELCVNYGTKCECQKMRKMAEESAEA
ncbi:DNA-(apurinic or apyrimidinic site) lyase /endonuclease III [Cyclonatronum proteinivorum]|uniref:Endonuclease III n=1 Tax=Cyclonatronum proteinivorum TaxID=1457365 RepID=A0A345UHU3_9BACT|nr:endonuclease III [Cyclonatronum proteinivorum]AXJ00045.1 DNA-(apurinic or apyrimidinic site) lyase /endonuclease III [Cyclonatronum proteinivorum]